MQFSQGTQQIINELEVFEARMESSLDTLNEKIDALRWFIGAVGVMAGVMVSVATKIFF